MDDNLATNPAPTADEQPAPEVAADDDALIQGDVPDLDPDATPEADEANPDEAPAEEFEEVEHEGKKYTVAKSLKPLLMFQADYTKKTQEVAETRKEIEARGAALVQSENALAEHIVEVSTLVGIDKQLQQYEANFAEFAKIDWDAWDRQNPDASREHWRNRELLKQRIDDLTKNRDQLAEKLRTDYQQKTEKQQREKAAKLAAGQAELAKEIPNWTPERGKTLATFATSTYGLSAERVNGYTDPGEVRALNDAYLWRQHVAKQRAAAGKPAVVAQPVPQVGARRSPAASNEPKDSDSIEVWNRKMDAIEAKKRANGQR